ncbi:hypothetical protein HDV63DRAFT_71703 [Trichoderma sp. SZMC 28014]
MVWPSPPAIKNPSSSAPHRRLSIGRLHRTASPSSQQDWQHQRQQQWLDLIPYDPPSSSMPSTGLPSSEEEDMFRLAHATSPFANSNNSPFEPRQELQIQPFSVAPSAQPRSSFLSSSSPPPFANMSTYSTQAASYSLPSPPTSQLDRPESPSSVADSQPTLRQGDSPRVLSPPMSPIPRPQRVSGDGGRHAPSSEAVDTQALNAVVDGIGRMQVNMNLDQAGRWRIARRPGAPW